MSTPRQLNMGAWVAVTPGMLAGTFGATTTSTAARNGITVDRLALARRYLSAKATATYTGSRESTGLKTHSVTVSVEDSADGNNWTAYSTDTVPAASVFGATSTAAGGTAVSTNGAIAVAQDVNLLRARRYIRMVATPLIGATSSGNEAGVFGALWAFSGAEVYPAT